MMNEFDEITIKNNNNLLGHLDSKDNAGTGTITSENDNIITLLSYNTYLLDGVTIKIGDKEYHIGAKPAFEDRAKEIASEVVKPVNMPPGLNVKEKNYEIIALCEVFSPEVQKLIEDRTPQYTHIPGPGDLTLKKGSGLYQLIISSRKTVCAPQSIVFSHQGNLMTDADAYSRKGVLLTRIDVGVGIIDLYSTHLYAGGGLEPYLPGPSGDYVRETRAKQLDEFVQFFEKTHQKKNVAVFCGDFNNTPDDDFFAKIFNMNLYPFNWKNTGNTTGDPSRKDGYDDDCCNPGESPTYCTKGKGQPIDYVFVEKQTSDHNFKLEVKSFRRRPFPRSYPTDGQYYLSDHLGLEVIFIASTLTI
jgi:endonuclease/exonuclease/phosphatase family metal-dependent hydrolase